MIVSFIEFNTNYTVNELGEVYSISSSSKLKPFLTTSGLWAVRLPLIGTKVSKQFYVHKLVADHLLDNPNNYKFVIFKDNDCDNLNLNNLTWVKNPRFSKRGKA